MVLVDSGRVVAGPGSQEAMHTPSLEGLSLSFLSRFHGERETTNYCVSSLLRAYSYLRLLIRMRHSLHVPQQCALRCSHLLRPP